MEESDKYKAPNLPIYSRWKHSKFEKYSAENAENIEKLEVLPKLTTAKRYDYSEEQKNLLNLYNSLEIGSLWILPTNTTFWSVALQMNICSDRDLVVKITNKIWQSGFGIQTGLFAIIQDEFYFNGEQYRDKKNGEIRTSMEKLKPLNKYESND